MNRKQAQKFFDEYKIRYVLAQFVGPDYMAVGLEFF